jgi:hypothetical protein
MDTMGADIAALIAIIARCEVKTTALAAEIRAAVEALNGGERRPTPPVP